MAICITVNCSFFIRFFMLMLTYKGRTVNVKKKICRKKKRVFIHCIPSSHVITSPAELKGTNVDSKRMEDTKDDVVLYLLLQNAQEKSQQK